MDSSVDTAVVSSSAGDAAMDKACCDVAAVKRSVDTAKLITCVVASSTNDDTIDN